MSKKILIVDDDQDILEALEIYFSDLGFLVIKNNDGKNIQELVKQVMPHILLMDMLLSGIDGAKLTKELKEDKRTKDVPILLLSAHPNAKIKAEESGANGFLPKPFELDKLLYEIEKFI